MIGSVCLDMLSKILQIRSMDTGQLRSSEKRLKRLKFQRKTVHKFVYVSDTLVTNLSKRPVNTGFFRSKFKVKIRLYSSPHKPAPV